MNNSLNTSGNGVPVRSAANNLSKRRWRITIFSLLGLGILTILLILGNSSGASVASSQPAPGNHDLKGQEKSKEVSTVVQSSAKVSNNNFVDSALYNEKLLKMANGDSSGKWPVRAAYPVAGAIFPFNRVIAFYGNLYSKGMGILGELPRKEMLAKLMDEVKTWQAVDTSVSVLPALHYIATTAQLAPGKGSKYRLRMPFHQIDSVLSMAKEIDALVFLDIQVGHSSLEEEIPLLENYLKMPNVHLGIDPEFSMKTAHKPGQVVGTFDAADINYVSGYLAKLVQANNLPPKALVIHRFTQGMLTNYKNIKTAPEVQLVIDMDGWGGTAKKINTYKQYVYKEPVQFTGFKLFYKNDVKSNGRMLKPEELLQLKPQPVYIQYQ